jgi:hypothetical protein
VVLNQVSQNLIGFGAKRHFLAVAAQHAAVQVQRELAKRILAAGLLSWTRLRAAHPISLPRTSKCLLHTGFDEYLRRL